MLTLGSFSWQEKVFEATPVLYKELRVFSSSVTVGYVPENVTIGGEYQLNFHISNWNLSNMDPISLEYITLKRDIEEQVKSLSNLSSLPPQGPLSLLLLTYIYQVITSTFQPCQCAPTAPVFSKVPV